MKNNISQPILSIVVPCSPCCNQQRLYNLDTLKFVFSIIIIYFHLVRSVPTWLGNTDLFEKLANCCRGAHLIVECFLIIAGYFMYTGYKKKTEFCSFLAQRLIRLWPVLAFYALVVACFRYFRLELLLTDLFFLRATGSSLQNKEIVWYISPFFWSSLLLFALLTTFRHKLAILCIAVLVYVGYSININNLTGNLGREVTYSWLSLGFLRCLAGLGSGILIGVVKDSFFDSVARESRKKYGFFIASVLEFTCCALLIQHFLIDRLFQNAVITVILFSILMVSFVLNAGLISHLLNSKYLSHCGKYCYSIYVMQIPSFLIMERTVWKYELFSSNCYVFIGLSLLLSVLIGILTYYVIEQPGAYLLRRFFSLSR